MFAYDKNILSSSTIDDWRQQQQRKRQEMLVHGIVTNLFLPNSEAQMFHKHTETDIRTAGNIHGA